MNGQSNGQSWAGARADEVFPSSLAGGVALGNQAVAEPLSAEQTTELVSLVSKNFEQLFDILGIDHCNDHNTRDTPRRVAKMLVLETLRGRLSISAESGPGFSVQSGPIPAVELGLSR